LLAEQPAAGARVAGGRPGIAVAPAVRREPVGGEEAEESRQGRLGRDAVQIGRLVRVRLGREVEGREQASRDLVLAGEGHRRDPDRERDRRRSPVGETIETCWAPRTSTVASSTPPIGIATDIDDVAWAGAPPEAENVVPDG